MKESHIQNEIMLAMSAAGLLTWRNHVGVYRAMDSDRVIKIGTPGQPDIMAIMPIIITPEMVGQLVGLSYNVEVKTATGRQSQGQQAWQKQAEQRGAVYQVARSVDEFLANVKKQGPITCRR